MTSGQKSILVIGMICLTIAFLFPPYDYVSYTSSGVSHFFGSRERSEVAFFFIFTGVHDGEGKLAGGMWAGILIAIAALTIVAALIASPTKQTSPSK